METGSTSSATKVIAMYTRERGSPEANSGLSTSNLLLSYLILSRSPDAEFGGLIGWLFNWKCKFSCRMISKIANYLKYNYFWDGDGIENVTSQLWKFSYFCSRHTVGVAGVDIMFHILVFSWDDYLSPCWPRSLLPNGVTRPQCVSTLAPAIK